MSQADTATPGLYLSFYGLAERPFAITPDPRYLFLSGRHAEALAHLVYGIDEAGGFIQLTGEVGTGKTTVIRALLARAPQGAEIALIFNPRMDASEFMLTICEELGIMVPNDAVGSVKDLIDILNAYLLRAHAEGRRVVLIVDEAQNLSPDLLEQVRLLTNLETDTQKLLQIILIGQPELRDLLSRNDLRQLAQRITGRYHLEPLARRDAETYVKHRLRIAGATHDLFTDGALRELYRASGGVPRLLNIIADRALLGGYSQDRHQVTGGMVRRAAGEVLGRRLLPRWLAPLLISAVAVVVAAVLALLVQRSQQDSARAAAAAVVELPAKPVVETPPTPAEPATLEAMLQAAPDEGGRNAVWEQLFSYWGASFAADSKDDACEQALRQGIECLGQNGTVALLRALNRPVMLDLLAGDTRHPAALATLDEKTATLWFGGSPHVVPVEQFLAAWQGDFVLLWKPPSLDTRALTVGMRGPAVQELRSRLARWRGVAAKADDRYDTGLQKQVRELQRQFGLKDDGIAGTTTQAVLDAAVPGEGTPLLAAPHQETR